MIDLDAYDGRVSDIVDALIDGIRALDERLARVEAILLDGEDPGPVS